MININDWYVLATQGDGAHSALLVPGRDLKDVVHEEMCACGGTWQNCATGGVASVVETLDDESQWSRDESGQPSRWLQRFEDGSIELLRLTDVSYISDPAVNKALPSTPRFVQMLGRGKRTGSEEGQKLQLRPYQVKGVETLLLAGLKNDMKPFLAPDLGKATSARALQEAQIKEILNDAVDRLRGLLGVQQIIQPLEVAGQFGFSLIAGVTEEDVISLHAAQSLGALAASMRDDAEVQQQFEQAKSESRELLRKFE